jgi:hypothetical protein
MSSSEDREKHSRRRKRNFVAKILRDPGEHKGAFALRVKQENYKRIKLNPREIESITDENEPD